MLTLVAFVLLGAISVVVVTVDRFLLRAYRRHAEESGERAELAIAHAADMQQSYDAMAAERQALHERTLTRITALHAASLAETEKRYEDAVEAIHARYATALVRLQAHQPPPKVLRLHGDQQP